MQPYRDIQRIANRMLFLLQSVFYNFVVNEFVESLLVILVLVAFISGSPLLGLDASTQ